jgi:hypothetical protein
LNINPWILLHTPHDVLSAPYHRSAAALSNGVLPFTGDEQAMRDVVERHGPAYVVVCRNQIYGQEASFGTALARMQGPPWLELVQAHESGIVAWRVRSDRIRDLWRAPVPPT